MYNSSTDSHLKYFINHQEDKIQFNKNYFFNVPLEAEPTLIIGGGHHAWNSNPEKVFFAGDVTTEVVMKQRVFIT